MTDNTYKVTEVVGTSTESVAEAIRNGVTKTSETVRNLDWFEVTEIRGHIEDGAVAHFQVGLKIGFRLD
jgi:dodecin